MKSSPKTASFSFEPGWYTLRVREVELEPNPELDERTTHRVRFIFDVLRETPNNLLVHFNERLDVYANIGSDGIASGTQVADFLRNLGVDPETTPPDQYNRLMRGRFIKGRIGKPGVRGYQPLPENAECEPAGVMLRLLSPDAVVESIGRPCPLRLPPDEKHPKTPDAVIGGEERPERQTVAPNREGEDDDGVKCKRPPILRLRALDGRGANKVYVAKLIGEAGSEFADVDVRLGYKQLFFLYLLFNSERTCEGRDGHCWTIVAESEARELFAEWVDRDLLKNGGECAESPETRITKNWHRFIEQFQELRGLRGLFHSFPRPNDMSSEKIYAIRLRNDQIKNEISDIDELLGRLARP
jgi:hypothetical protein